MAAAMTVREIPLGDPRMRAFVRFHWQHYRGNVHWVPQLDGDLLGNRMLGLTGLLTPRHPYHRSAHATHFLAYRGRAIVGRISVVVHDRFDAHYRTKMAFFGFFETIDDLEIARGLLDAAATWARARGATTLRGPGEYANVTHERQGCLVEGFDEETFVEHTWNPPYYAGLIEACGFVKAMDYRAYRIDLRAPLSPKLERVADAVVHRHRIRTRSIDLARFDADLRLVVDLYHRAWADNWGFLPIEDWEVDALVHQLRPIVDPGLVRFAYEGDRPVAVLGAFPDPNVLLRPRWRWFGDGDPVRLARLAAGRRRIDRIRVMFFGILPGHRGAGADALLYRETHAYALRQGYVGCDMSLLLEVNAPMVRITESMGARRYKTWRIWDLPLEA
jgi:GNAT superfamily N-acetyltransferase